jgi:hypothetical protein
MILTLENLHAGISWWGARWDLDLMNADYFAIYEARANGFTESWWSATVATLSRWQAYRGPKPPNRKEEITKRGLDELTHLASEYSKLVEGSRSEPCIADLHWEEVEPMFTIAFGIKPSYVFAGKMCHCLLPKAFLVMDNVATGVSQYEIYWRGMRNAWSRFNDKEEARTVLGNAIVSEGPVHQWYPFETKIMELCHIGQFHS